MDNYSFTLPRLYTPNQSFETSAEVTLSADQVHYLRNVMRAKTGDSIRLFNGKDGEWLGAVTELGKKSAVITLSEQIKEQPKQTERVYLICPPLKKHRMDILIEKAVELGITDLHPVVTHHTDVRKINTDRIETQITEAAEQCERFTIPTLHPLKPLDNFLAQWDKKVHITACVERYDAPHIADISFEKDKAFLIGPAGGFSEQEKTLLASHDFIQPVSLGDTIFRVETAVMYCLIQTHGK